MAWDVLVVGGGHAGVEAAAAAARRGARTALLSHARATIGAMSCNPAIGGLGKGHLVREVDALDGLIGVASDWAAIHYRMLNRSKGPAVQGPRVQADRRHYAAAIQRLLAETVGLDVIEAEASSLLLKGGRVVGLRLADGTSLLAKSIVLATGTFLNARLFRGSERFAGGRIDEAASTELGDQLRRFGLPIGRLKTGTPPRIDGRTIDWSSLARQSSEDAKWSMSPFGRRVLPQLFCAITRTNGATHDIIRAGMASSPLATGAIEGEGPRYCPSVEDKVIRFGDRDGHQVFLEPEGLGSSLIYPNGLSTSLSTETQIAFVRSIAGLEAAEITVPGYAVEYDYVDPRSLDHRLALPEVPGLFCAGQINGTTGYEEAAAQGLIAGANAAAHALALEPLCINRQQGYLGVMIDDLVLQGVSEPYRMLTARAEHRLALRADNAATRLTQYGVDRGIVGAARARWWVTRADELENARAGGGHVATDIAQEVETDRHYAPYVARQEAELNRLSRSDALSLAKLTDYSAVPGVSTEMAERLSRARPAVLGEARRIRGVTPAALAAVMVVAQRVHG